MKKKLDLYCIFFVYCSIEGKSFPSDQDSESLFIWEYVWSRWAKEKIFERNIFAGQESREIRCNSITKGVGQFHNPAQREIPPYLNKLNFISVPRGSLSTIKWLQTVQKVLISFLPNCTNQGLSFNSFSMGLFFIHPLG